MVFDRELNELRERKVMLLVESRLQRSLLNLDVARLRDGLGVVRRGAGWLRACQPYLPFLAPVAGYVLIRKWRLIARLGGRALVAKLMRGVMRRRA